MQIDSKIAVILAKTKGQAVKDDKNRNKIISKM